MEKKKTKGGELEFKHRLDMINVLERLVSYLEPS